MFQNVLKGHDDAMLHINACLIYFVNILIPFLNYEATQRRAYGLAFLITKL